MIRRARTGRPQGRVHSSPPARPRRRRCRRCRSPSVSSPPGPRPAVVVLNDLRQGQRRRDIIVHDRARHVVAVAERDLVRAGEGAARARPHTRRRVARRAVRLGERVLLAGMTVFPVTAAEFAMPEKPPVPVAVSVQADGAAVPPLLLTTDLTRVSFGRGTFLISQSVIVLASTEKLALPGTTSYVVPFFVHVIDWSTQLGSSSTPRACSWCRP